MHDRHNGYRSRRQLMMMPAGDRPLNAPLSRDLAGIPLGAARRPHDRWTIPWVFRIPRQLGPPCRALRCVPFLDDLALGREMVTSGLAVRTARLDIHDDAHIPKSQDKSSGAGRINTGRRCRFGRWLSEKPLGNKVHRLVRGITRASAGQCGV
jgi:hypothetical protein